MSSIELLGIAFGLAMLSGLNLYLTVFATGLAIRMQWITLGSDFQQLHFLADNWVLAIAGVLFVIEFFADKIPWVDSFWDTLHTIIRPVGGALLATRAMGDASPTFLIIAGLLAGSLSLGTHSAKAATRLIANGSPEPFTNIGLSLVEDLLVLGGLLLLHLNPVVALVVFLLFFGVVLYFAPKIFRAVKAKVWFAYRKLTLPALGRNEEGLSDVMPGNTAEAFSKMNILGEKVLWAVPCISRKGPRIPANLSGMLIATVEEKGRLYFVVETRWNHVQETLELEGGYVEMVSGFLYDEVRLADAENKRRWSFAFDRPRVRVVEEMVKSIRARIQREVEPVPVL